MKMPEHIINTNLKEFSKDEIEKIFQEFLQDFVFEKEKQKEEEHRVLIDKLDIITKGKEILIDNSFNK